MLQAKELVRRFSGKTLLQIEQFHLQPGECVHLQGANGAGKTTLMKLLAGLDRPCAGTISLKPYPSLLGCPWLGRKLAHLQLRGQVLYMHQRPYLFDTSVRRNILFSLGSLKLSRQEQRARLDQALELTELRDQATEPARRLSGGEQQRLALARAWVRQPRWLLLDEPCSSIDQKSIQHLSNLIEQLASHGSGILLSSHQNNCFTGLCSRTLRLERGRLR